MKIDRFLGKRKGDARKQPAGGTQIRLPMSPEEFTERLETIERELKSLRAETKLATQLAYTVEEAAQITRIGINELRERCAMAAGEALHIRAVHIGRRIVIPRSELMRHLDGQAR